MSIEHGNYLTYRNGLCNDECCRRAHREKVAQNRADRLANGRINHGKRSGYDAGCRCQACRSARHAASVRESRRAAQARHRARQRFQDRSGAPRLASEYPETRRNDLSGSEVVGS